FEGERFFEGTRSLFTAQGIEKPVLNAYRMLSRLGDTRLAVDSSRTWSLDRLDDGEAAMPEEIDALAAAGADGVRVLVWRHADDQYATDADAGGVARARCPPGALAVRPARHRGAPAARAVRARPDRHGPRRRADGAGHAPA